MKTLLRNVVLGVSLALTYAASAVGQSPPGTCSAESFTSFEKALVAAQAAFQSGNPEPLKALWSHADDVTLMGPTVAMSADGRSLAQGSRASAG